jgi:hypothetical protein
VIGIDNQNKKNSENEYSMNQKTFYPPQDTRMLKSGVEDVEGGDSFADYTKWFFDNYGKDLFDN